MTEIRAVNPVLVTIGYEQHQTPQSLISALIEAGVLSPRARMRGGKHKPVDIPVPKRSEFDRLLAKG